MKTKLILILIILLAGFFRLYGVNWDQGHHLHPDERFLTMVATAIKKPSTLTDYLNPQVSTMSPYNNNYGFFVYGTLPLNLVKVIGEWTKQNTYDTIHLLGRQTSAFFDIGVVLLVFLIGRKIWNVRVGLWSAFLYSIMVLPIQLSHFFAVDTFLNFFIVLSFYFLVQLLTSHPHFSTRSSTVLSSLSKDVSRPTSHFLIAGALGASFGCALACKISAIYFAPIIALGFLYIFYKSIKSKKKLLFVVCCLLFVLTSLLVFRFNQPQAFLSGNFFDWQPNPKFIQNLKDLQNLNKPDNWYPPAVQWKSVKPILFPFGNLIMWGLGLPLGIVSIAALLYLIAQLLKHSIVYIEKRSLGILVSYYPNILVVLWVFGLFFYQGSQTVPSMRYFLPIYPFIALISAWFINTVFPKFSKLPKIPKVLLLLTFYFLILLYPVSFLSVYSHPITRVTASEWIYKNIPSGSTILNEEWDDGLPIGNPLTIIGKNVNYKGVSVFMYDEDTPEKWARIQPIIDQSDYLMLSSGRAYNGLLRLPLRNPQTIKYYQSLFNSSGNFIKVAEFTSRPCFPPFGDKHLFCFNDDNAEEAFTVYDHPKVMIFERKTIGGGK